MAPAKTELQQDQTQLYESLTKVLNPEEQQIVQNVIAQADSNAIHALNAQAAAGQQTNGATH